MTLTGLAPQCRACSAAGPGCPHQALPLPSWSQGLPCRAAGPLCGGPVLQQQVIRAEMLGARPKSHTRGGESSLERSPGKQQPEMVASAQQQGDVGATVPSRQNNASLSPTLTPAHTHALPHWHTQNHTYSCTSAHSQTHNRPHTSIHVPITPTCTTHTHTSHAHIHVQSHSQTLTLSYTRNATTAQSCGPLGDSHGEHTKRNHLLRND